MTPAEFRASTTAAQPPAGIQSPTLLALWWDAKGAWAQSHDLVAEAEGRDAAWVHAYLHRREGDQSNAAYWYRRAGRPVATSDFDTEWGALVEDLLGSLSHRA